MSRVNGTTGGPARTRRYAALEAAAERAADALRRACPLDLDLARLDELDERSHDRRVEPGARAERELRERLAQRAVAAERARAGHVVERVDRVQDAALLGDRLAGQPERVATAVVALVHVAHPLRGLRLAGGHEQVAADLRVVRDLLELLEVERVVL